MIPVFQTTFKEKGNCLPAVLASLFHDSIEEWDECAAWRDDWQEKLSAKLAVKELCYTEIYLADDAVRAMSLVPQTLYILGVTSRNGLPHVVIGRYAPEPNVANLVFKIVHDPLGPGPWKYQKIDSIILLYRPFFA